MSGSDRNLPHSGQLGWPPIARLRTTAPCPRRSELRRVRWLRRRPRCPECRRQVPRRRELPLTPVEPDARHSCLCRTPPRSAAPVARFADRDGRCTSLLRFRFASAGPLRALSGTNSSQLPAKPQVKSYFRRHRVLHRLSRLSPGIHPSSTVRPPFRRDRAPCVHRVVHILHRCNSAAIRR